MNDRSNDPLYHEQMMLPWSYISLLRQFRRQEEVCLGVCMGICMCMCVYVYVCVCMYLYVGVYVCVRVHVYV